MSLYSQLDIQANVKFDTTLKVIIIWLIKVTNADSFFFFSIFLFNNSIVIKIGEEDLSTSSPNKEEKIMPLSYNTFDNKGEY